MESLVSDCFSWQNQLFAESCLMFINKNSCMFLIHAAPLTVTANNIDIRHNYYYRPFTSIKPQILFFIRCVIHQCIYGT